MCGRYTLMTDDEYMDLKEIVQEVSRTTGAQVNTEGDIYPTNNAPVLLNRDGHRLADLFKWGFPNFYRKGVIINARSETAEDKPTFRPCLETGPCYVILTTAANRSVADIHDRMPLVLQSNQINPWLEDVGAALSILHGTPPLLQRKYA